MPVQIRPAADFIWLPDARDLPTIREQAVLHQERSNKESKIAAVATRTATILAVRARRDSNGGRTYPRPQAEKGFQRDECLWHCPAQGPPAAQARKGKPFRSRV